MGQYNQTVASSNPSIAMKDHQTTMKRRGGHKFFNRKRKKGSGSKHNNKNAQFGFTNSVVH